MPAQSYGSMTYSQRNKVPRLSAAHEIGQFVRVDCSLCRVRRFYMPEDIQKLCGDLNAFELHGKFRCDRCGDREAASIYFVTLLAHEIQGLVVRRLQRIEVRHVPIWQDVTM